MRKLIKPSLISGIAKVPASKSMMQRAIAAALLAKETSILKKPTYCEDALASLDAACSLGALIAKHENKIIITGKHTKIIKNEIFCRESGLCMRMFTPIAALWNEQITLSGEKSLLNRPVSTIEQPLRKLGAKISTNNGMPPVLVGGLLSGGTAHIDGSVSSQFLTGLLMALPCAKKNSHLIVSNLKSKPYINMTISLLSEFGIEIGNNNYEDFFIQGKQKYQACEYIVERDWSSAAFLLVAGAVSNGVEIQFLNSKSTQADKAILDILEKTGAKIVFKNNSIAIHADTLKAFEADATHCPDLFPPLAALAVNCKGTSIIKGVSRLKNKESNRTKSLLETCRALGIEAYSENDYMFITGGQITGGTVNSFNDHRIAMTATVMALNASSEVLIENAECIDKSYPQFYADMTKLGTKIYDL